MARTNLTLRQLRGKPREVITKLTEHDAALDAVLINQTAGQSSRVGAGAIPLTHRTCLLETDSADALTIAAGALGQRLTITMTVDAGDGTLTGTFEPALTSIVFSAIRQSVDLEMGSTGWIVVGNNGTAIT
ncbi:MAG TPA: hypothetical protein VFV05_09495 [Methylomirabilota bacterium]|nr:hypothetical protein [Methylomirabilota bacterium]